LEYQIKLEICSIVIEHLPSIIMLVSRLGIFLLEIGVIIVEKSNDKTFYFVGFDHFRSGFG
jgi:hypothetical protein